MNDPILFFSRGQTLTPEGMVVTDQHVKYYQELDVPAELKADTIKGLKDCAASTVSSLHIKTAHPAVSRLHIIRQNRHKSN